MERNTCPVCGKNLNKQGQCPECGYDFSADAEQFDTLSSKLSEKQKTKTRLREQTSIINGGREADDVVVSVNSSGLAQKKGLQPALVLAAVAVLLALVGAFEAGRLTAKVPEPQTSAPETIQTEAPTAVVEETYSSVEMIGFDYAYSDDPADNAKYTAEEFAEVVKSDNVRELLPLGTRIKMIPNSEEITDKYIEFELVAYKHFERADGSGMAQTTWLAVNLLNETRGMNGYQTNFRGWQNSNMRKWLNETLYPSLPSYWKNLMVQVAVSSTAGDKSKEIVTSADYLFLPAAGEVDAWYLKSSDYFVFYSSEISSDAEERTFIRFTNESVTRVKKRQGVADKYWLRSPSVSSAANFCNIGSSGNSGNGTAASFSYGVCPGFCM